MAQVTVKLNNVEFNFDNYQVSDNLIADVQESYEDKIVTLDVYDKDPDEEFFGDYVIEAITDYLQNVSGWQPVDYNFEIVAR